MDTYLVGGAVRDQLLGLPVHERDWVVVGVTPEEMQAQGYRPVGREFPVFLHPQTHEEYALARTERKTTPGHQGFQFNTSPNVTLEEDLRRRDLTINAIAQDANGVLIDPHGGRRDLEARQLRHVSPAFSEDPLRVLRVARLSAHLHHLGFQLAPETQTLMRTMAHSGELDTLSAERVFSELRRALMEPHPERFVATLRCCEAWPVIFPLIPDARAVEVVSRRAADAALSEIARFACMAWHSSDVAAWCAALRVPRAWTQMSTLLAAQCNNWSDLDACNASTMLCLIETADGIRRPERFHEFRAAARVLTNTAPVADAALERALAAVIDCDVQSALQQRDKRPVQEQVRELRLAAVRDALDE